MIDVKTLYEPSKWGWDEYEPMINAFGNVAIEVTDRGYSGDTRILYDNNGKIGHLVFGWGSCSGCDALRACDDFEELQELCNGLESEIKWFDNATEALAWFKSHDWKGDYLWYEEKGREYIEKAIAYLSEKVGVQSVIEDLSNNTEHAKAEAIKEFAERVKAKSLDSYRYDYKKNISIQKKFVDTEDIDELVKEMVGDTE